MSDPLKVPPWFWLVGAICLAWNLMGVMAYLSQVMMTPEALAILPSAERELYEAMPAWANGAFAVAVWGGAGGCLLLLLKRSGAFYLFVASLVGIAIQMFNSFFISNSFEVYGPGGMIMPVMIIAIACFLVWFCLYSKRQGWLN